MLTPGLSRNIKKQQLNLYVCKRRIVQEHIVQLDIHYTKQVCESFGCVKSLFQIRE